MPEKHQETRLHRGRRILAHLVRLVLLGLAALTLIGCGRLREAGLGPETRGDPAAAIRQVAVEYAQTGDLQVARAALDALDLANPVQLVVGLADEAIAAGQPERDALARLAADLGASSPRLQAYLRPTPAPSDTPAPQPPTETPQPTVAPTDTAAPTIAPTDTAAPTAAPTATPAPQTPRAVAESNVNLRGGPGRQYPTVGTLRAGLEADIIGRNASGDWWQLAWDGGQQAWVAGTVVKIVGPIDTVVVAENIPAPPPTAAPRPTSPPVAAAPTAAPKAAVDFRIAEQRMLSIDENGGCLGKHNIYVQVVDAGGAPLNGVAVQRITTGETIISGEKDCRWNLGVTGEGCAHFDIYGGGDQVRISADPARGPVSSEVSNHFSTQDADIGIDLLLANGYCSDRADCEYRMNPGPDKPRQFCNGHYSWQIKFQRTW